MGDASTFGPLIGQFGALGVTIWLIWYYLARVVPEQNAAWRNELAAWREELKAQREEQAENRKALSELSIKVAECPYRDD